MLEVLIAVDMKIAVFLEIMPCSLVKSIDILEEPATSIYRMEYGEATEPNKWYHQYDEACGTTNMKKHMLVEMQ
jgi:hypothetical protein